MNAKTKKMIAGKNAESLIMQILKKGGIYDEYCFYDFCYAFESSFANSSHQIDCLLIQKNIYLIEVKGYKQIIKFEFEAENWVLEFHRAENMRSRKRNGVDNPILQNRNHRFELSKHITVDPSRIIALSTIVSETDYTFGRPWVEINKQEYLCRPEELVNLILTIENRSNDSVSKDLIKEEIQNLPFCSNYKHIQYANEIKCAIKIARENNINLNKYMFTDKRCRDCGDKMFIRNSKHKLFYGCGSYPYCRKIVNLNN